MCQEVTSCTTGCFTVWNVLWEAFLSLPSLLKFSVVSINKIHRRCCRDCRRDRNFAISATLVAPVVLVATIAEDCVSVAETRFSTTVAIVATGAIIWKSGLTSGHLLFSRNKHEIWKLSSIKIFWTMMTFTDGWEKKIAIHGGLLKVKGLSQKGMASLSSVSNGKISVFVCICVLKINAYRLNFRWIPVSYTHLTLPTTPYV